MNDNNVNSEEILTEIKKGNKAYCMNEKLLHQGSLQNNPK